MTWWNLERVAHFFFLKMCLVFLLKHNFYSFILCLLGYTFCVIVNWLCRVGVTGGELLTDKLENKVLQKGLLLEFKKDSERVLLAVAQRPDGKKNWMVYDQVLVETPNAAC